jgi:hypothetical protein
LFLKTFPKLTEVGEITTGTTPVPVNVTVSGLEGSLLTMMSEAVSVPVIDGVKVTFTVQVPAGGMERLLTQVAPLIAKSAAFGPEIVTALDEARTRLAVPELVTVTV